MSDVQDTKSAAATIEHPGDDAAVTVTDSKVAVPAEKKTVKKIIRRKKRPARAQIDPSSVNSEPPPQTGTVFNIWYSKWSGGDRESHQQFHARGRCNVAKDSGYTKADKTAGSYFCRRFARGLCPRGQDCDYLHRIPGTFDLFSPNVDCFGREKFADYRDDMGGVGSFMRQNRTIYVGRIHVTDDIEEIVARHFAEWGPIERIRVLNSRGVGFITYINEANAEFAREAMAHQSLDHDEVLNVRWATVDPNPMAQKREARKIEEQAAEVIRKALPAEFVAEIEGKDSEARKRRRIESSYGLEGYIAPDKVHFARGANAVNPRGRQGYVTEQQRDQAPSAPQIPKPAQIELPTQQETGIFSESTLAALSRATVSVPLPSTTQAAGPRTTGALVAYGSDSDDE